MKTMRKCNDEITNYLRTRHWLKILKTKDKRFKPLCSCPSDVMFLTCGSKNSLFFVFDSLSNLDCGQWYKCWIYQMHPMSALATQSVDSRARASFVVWTLLCPFILCWMVGHFPLRIATHRRDSRGGKPH